MRFSVNMFITDEPSDFKAASDTLSAPLARKLFGFPWTAGVYIGRDFVTVTKQDWVEWDVLAEPLTGLITEHLERGEPVITKNSKASPASGASANHSADPNDEPAVQVIKRVLDQEIRPAVAQDGGDVVFSKYEDRIVLSLYARLLRRVVRVQR